MIKLSITFIHHLQVETSKNTQKLAGFFPKGGVNRVQRFWKKHRNHFESINNSRRIDRGAFVARMFPCSFFSCGESPRDRFFFRPTVINAPSGQNSARKKEEKSEGKEAEVNVS